ncbi:MAG: SDR family NAD(P)-dependent oxidoreductase, partial [Cyclobacteriaceae bacterium]
MDILVIGGTSGIGKAIVEKLVNEGHEVHAAARNKPEEPLDQVNYLQLDALGDDLEFDLEKLDGLVYAPGSINLKPFNRLKEDDFLDDFRINVVGAVKVLQAAYPLLKKSDQASVILFSTVAVSQGMPYHSSTAASKAAVEGLMRSLAAEWAPSIRINAVAPSITDTPMASRILSSDERRKNSAERHPLNR